MIGQTHNFLNAKSNARLLFVIMTWILGCYAVTARAADAADNRTVAYEKTASSQNTVVPGGIYRWTPPVQATDIRFNARPVMRVQHQVLVGIPLSQPLGSATLTYQVAGEAMSHNFDIFDKAYTEQHITLQNTEMVNPNPKQLARIREESQRQRALYLRYSDAPAPTSGFIQPLQGRISSLFGHRRFFNGQPRNPHSGLDLSLIHI